MTKGVEKVSLLPGGRGILVGAVIHKNRNVGSDDIPKGLRGVPIGLEWLSAGEGLGEPVKT
jgi:hypothetical protein